MSENDYVHLFPPGYCPQPGERERTMGATDMLRIAAKPILEKHGGEALLDALISVWLDLQLTLGGQTRVEAYLRQIRKDVPRIAAARSAVKRAPEGRA